MRVRPCVHGGLKLRLAADTRYGPAARPPGGIARVVAQLRLLIHVRPACVPPDFLWFRCRWTIGLRSQIYARPPPRALMQINSNYFLRKEECRKDAVFELSRRFNPD